MTVDGRRCPQHGRSIVRRRRAPAVRRARRAARARLWRSRGGFDLPAVFGSRATSLISRDGPVRRPRAGRRRRAAGRTPRARPHADGARRAAAAAAPAARGCASSPGRTTRCSRRRRSRRCSAARFTVDARVQPHGIPARGSACSRTRRRPTSCRTRRRSARSRCRRPGQPILLMADRQTTGGYPKIATVITADLPTRRSARARRLDRVRALHARGDALDALERASAASRGSVADERRFDGALRDAFGAERVRRDAPLAPLTTFKVGGPADWLVDPARRPTSCGRRSRSRATRGVPVTVLGGGSNVLVADAGVRGLVIRVHGGDVAAVDARTRSAPTPASRSTAWCAGRSTAASPASRPGPAHPGTVGGAIHGNAHFQGRLIGELVERVDARRRRGGTRRRGARGGDGIRLRLQPAAAHAARSSCRRTSASRRASRRRCAPSRASRWRSGSARSRSSRRAPAASSRTPIRRAIACPTASRASAGALVDRAGLKGAATGRRARVDDARELHRQRRRRDGGRHSRADRALQAAACASDSASSCAKRSSTSVRWRSAIATSRCDATHGIARLKADAGCPGRLTVEGNKNSALPLIAACLLTDRSACSSNVPRIRDVEVLAELLAGLGATVEGVGTPTLRIRCATRDDRSARSDAGRQAARIGAAARSAARAERLGAAGAAGRRLSGAAHDLRRTSQALVALGAVPLDEPGHALDAPDGLTRRLVLSRRGVGHRHRNGAPRRGRRAGTHGDPPRRDGAARRRAVPIPAGDGRRHRRRGHVDDPRRGAGAAAAARRIASTATTSRPAAGASSRRSPAATSRSRGARPRTSKSSRRRSQDGPELPLRRRRASSSSRRR